MCRFGMNINNIMVGFDGKIMQSKKMLSDLLANLTEETRLVHVVDISHITNNSREVTQNTLFLAYPGEKADGRKYISDAIANGAVAIAYEPQDFTQENKAVPCIPIKNLKTKQSIIAARFYGFPSAKIPVIGVTGTNGKTSITHFIAQSLGKCGVIGTVGYGFLSHLIKTANTTPDGLQLQAMFAELVDQGAQSIAMEVSSHALSQRRVNDVQFHTAVFTNLTQDHLDYHHTMENYRDAKALLFQQPGLKNAVINIDDDAGIYFAQKYKNKLNVITYSTYNKNADIYLEKCIPNSHGFQLSVKTPWGNGDFYLPLIGEFNIANALATLGVLGILEISFKKIVKQLSQLKTVSGRMQLFHVDNKPTVIVDYAHTPDALEKALKSVRAHCAGKVICVFGCGGDRDKTKRPKMGAIADQLSDQIIITNDNPRSESPEQIAQDILAGVAHKNKFVVALDREKAIIQAIQFANQADWILLAGKGHETDQIIGDEVLHHSDAVCVSKHLA